MRQHTRTVAVDLVADSHVVTEDGDILKTCPSAYRAVPSNNRALDPCVFLDLATLEQHGSLKTDTLTNLDIRSNDNIRSDLAVLANLGGGVNHDVAAEDIWLAEGSKLVAALPGQGGKIEAGAGEEILGLANVHPEALKVETVKLAVFHDSRESLLLDGGWAQLNALEHRGVENVDTGVDAVAHELDGLLDEAVDAGRVIGLVNNDTVFAGLLDLGDDNCSLLAVVLVEVCQLLEWVFANNIGVEDEER